MSLPVMTAMDLAPHLHQELKEHLQEVYKHHVNQDHWDVPSLAIEDKAWLSAKNLIWAIHMPVEATNTWATSRQQNG